MDSLSKLPNIGHVLAEKLKTAGIPTEKELKVLGSEKAFLLVREIDNTACLSHLCALEGAVQGIRWHNLPKNRKGELKLFFELCK
jgi:DNA transformation protein